jgi:dihydrofolate reductase
MIWAQGRNGEFGLNNSLPWNEPKDLAHFKETTMGSAVIMGRKTFESLGKPLPGRINIVLTSNLDKSMYHPDIWVYSSIPLLLNDLKGRTAYVIGGAHIFDSFMRFADTLHVTHIDKEFESDTTAPIIDKSVWQVKAGRPLTDYMVVRQYTKIKGDIQNDKLLL